MKTIEIRKICVIGSGVMGAGIAALAANSSIPVILLDIPSDDKNNRNSVAQNALSKAGQQKPPQFTHPDREKYITIGNLEDNLDYIKECDLVIEVIIEKLEIKHQLYNNIIPYLKKDAILASNTSTLPLSKLKSELPEDIKRRFVITHFFNPPRYMDLLELVTDEATDQEVITRLLEFLSKVLGKTIVKCNDTPGFIANRIGCYLLELVTRKAIEARLDPVVIDKIFTDFFKLPSTGIFGLYDLIGLDVMKLISTSLTGALPKADDYHNICSNSQVIDKLISQGLIGKKGAGGFYRYLVVDGKKTKEVINFADIEYDKVKEAPLEFNTFEELIASNSEYGKFFKEILIRFYAYVFSLSSVTDNIYDIDMVMKLGYNWRYGPFELLNSYFKWIQIPPTFTIDATKFSQKQDLSSAQIVFDDDAAKLLNYKGSSVFCIKTKMNCLSNEVFNLMLKAIDHSETCGQNLIIYPIIDHFSAGADLKFISSCIENNDFEAIESFIRLGQKTMMRLKHASINVISCAKGLALGGGCEILLHSDFILAHTELKAGLVEVGISLSPGFGGIKEMFIRGLDAKVLAQNLENIIKVNKSSSADYFIHDYGISDAKIIANKNCLLEEALQLVLPKKSARQINDRVRIPVLNIQFSQPLSALQNQLILEFQRIIDLKETDANSLLEFEVETFMKLVHSPSALEFLKDYLIHQP